jgi:hypothetical protein
VARHSVEYWLNTRHKRNSHENFALTVAESSSDGFTPVRTEADRVLAAHMPPLRWRLTRSSHPPTLAPAIGRRRPHAPHLWHASHHLALGCLVAPLATDAQPLRKIPRIGYLGETPGPHVDALHQGLHDLGYVEGQNLVIEYRSAEGQDERLPALAAELVRLPVDVIIAPGGTGQSCGSARDQHHPDSHSARGRSGGRGVGRQPRAAWRQYYGR